MIRFEHVTKRFGDKLVLDDVSCEIQAGETFVIVGLSGAGKSVSIRHMVRLLTPEQGRVWVGDDCISEATGRPLERILARFGVLFQGAALLQWLNVEDNVCLPLRQKTRRTPKSASAPPTCSGWSDWRAWAIACPPTSPGACASGSGWPGPS